MARPDYRIVRLKYGNVQQLSLDLMKTIDTLNATDEKRGPRDWCVHSFSATNDELVFLLKNSGADSR